MTGVIEKMIPLSKADVQLDLLPPGACVWADFSDLEVIPAKSVPASKELKAEAMNTDTSFFPGERVRVKDNGHISQRGYYGVVVCEGHSGRKTSPYVGVRLDGDRYQSDTDHHEIRVEHLEHRFNTNDAVKAENYETVRGCSGIIKEFQQCGTKEGVYSVRFVTRRGKALTFQCPYSDLQFIPPVPLAKEEVLAKQYGMSNAKKEEVLANIKHCQEGPPIGHRPAFTHAATIVLASGREVEIPPPNALWELVERLEPGPQYRVVIDNNILQLAQPYAIHHDAGRCWLKDMARLVNQTEHVDHFTDRYAYVKELRVYRAKPITLAKDDCPLPTLKAYLW